MTYGFVMDVAAPIQFYDALHAEINRRVPDGYDGALLHVARQTSTGFQLIEVWESKEQYERFTAEVFGPVVGALTGGQPPPVEPRVEEFEPRGLVIPSAHVVV